MKLPKLLTNSAIYTVIQILQKGISFLLLPVYTAFLTPDDYGILGVTSSVSSFLAIFITLSLSGAANRFYYKQGQDEIYCRKVFGTIAVITVVNSTAIGLLLWLLHPYILDPLLGDIKFYPFMFLTLLHTIVTPLYLLFQDYLRTRQDGVHFGINSTLNFVINVVLIVVSLTVFHMGVIGVLLANLITSVLFFIYVLLTFIRKVDFRMNKPLLKECMNYSLPLLPHTLANWSNGMIDRLLVNGLRSKSDAGLYNLGQQYGSIVNNIAIGINGAFTPWFYAKVNEGEAGRKQIARVAEAVVALVSLLSAALALFSKEILEFMTSNSAYNDVWKAIPFIIGAYIFQCVYFFYIQTLFLENTKVIFTVTIVTVIVNVLLNILLIPILGFMGAAVACFATYFIKSVMALIVSKIKKTNKYFSWHILYSIAFVGFGICLSSLFVSIESEIISIIIKLLILCVYTSIMTYHYRSTIQNFILSIKK